MNPELNLLQPYPFARIRTLLEHTKAAEKSPIALSIGEPKHAAPQFVLDALTEQLRTVETYPSSRGTDALRQAIASWLCQRFSLPDATRLAESQILPVNGTREALFAIAQCVLDRTSSKRNVLMPNPFYQIYEGAALLAGSKPDFYTTSVQADDDIDALTEAQLDNAQLIYICNPSNPSGAVISEPALQRLITRAEKHQFVIVSDECYSEIYREQATPPCSLLQAAQAMGNTEFKQCLVFHSLSKRSNLPGLRSGFVAGDTSIIKQFLLYRTYHGCSMSPPVQHASMVAWQDEEHVKANRRAYDEKYAVVVDKLSSVMDIQRPDAGFYLWPSLPISDEQFTIRMLAEQNIAVVPGSYLGREVNGVNPGSNHARLALVAPLAQCIEACERICESLST